MKGQSPRIVGIIPARMGSLRFPGKPLAPILGRPMIEHVYLRMESCETLDAVYVATCDQEIYDAVQGFGGRAVMTSPDHQRAADRTAESVHYIEHADIVIMVQGDEPMVTPGMIEASVQPLINDRSIPCSNLTARVTSLEEFEDPNCIKVVMDPQGFAIYMSREPVPTRGVLGFESIPIYKQVCIIPFQRDALLTFVDLEPTPLEKAESIDMLRFLEHGFKVKLVETQQQTHSVDTPGDLAIVESLMRRDPIAS